MQLWESVLFAHAEATGSLRDALAVEMVAIAEWLEARGDLAAAIALRGEAALAAPGAFATSANSGMSLPSESTLNA